MIVAPVVVKPDTISNKASTKLLVSPSSNNGTAPIILKTIQDKATRTKPSFAKKTLFLGRLEMLYKAGRPTIKPVKKYAKKPLS